MTLRTKIAALAGALGLSLLIAITAIGSGPASALAAAATPGTGGQTSGSSFLSKLAANLGIGEDTLTNGVKQTNLQLIDEAVAAGTMTEAEAQAARERINNGEVGFGIGGGKRGGQGRGGIGGGAMLSEATASFFGITTDQLRLDLQEAGSLQGVAAKYGKDNATDKAALQTALTNALLQQLTDKGVEVAEIESRATAFAQNFEQYYTSQHNERGPRGPQQSPAPSAAPSATS